MNAQALQVAIQRRGGYYLILAGFLVALAVLLLTVAEMRRGFLFLADGYFKVGSPSVILHLDPRQLPLLLAGLIGVGLAYLTLVRLERRLQGSGLKLKALTRVLGAGILVLLVADLFIYRGVPASRIVATGMLGVGQTIALEGWLRPLGQGLNYLALVWHATTLAVLLGALFLAVGAAWLKPLLGRQGFKAHLAGAAFAVPQPFCSCCSAPIAVTLYQGGASLGPTLAFLVSSPMLNPTTLILASVLLPGEFAALRVAGGLFVGVVVTYVVSLLASRWVGLQRGEPQRSVVADLANRLAEGYSRLFRFGDLLQKGAVDSPAALISIWFSLIWHLGRIAVPVLLVSTMATAAVVMVLPSPESSLLGVIAAAASGTLLMVPTWTEIPIAAGLLKEGLSGPAAALLLTLPAVSVPALLILGWGVRSLKVPLLLAALVFLTGISAGVLFL